MFLLVLAGILAYLAVGWFVGVLMMVYAGIANKDPDDFLTFMALWPLVAVVVSIGGLAELGIRTAKRLRDDHE